MASQHQDQVMENGVNGVNGHVPANPIVENNSRANEPITTSMDIETSDVDDDDADDASDTDSFLLDLIEDEEDIDFAPVQNPNICTLEEASRYKARVRKIGLDEFVAETVSAGVITAKKLCTAFGARLPDFWEGEPDSRYYRLLGVALAREVRQRTKLPQFNTIDDAVELLKTRKNIVVITGAGISTNLGIPDFRSQGSGFYSKMRELGFEDPQEIFDLARFDEDPTIFYTYAGETLPGIGKTSPTHAFIRLLQQEGKLLTNYTQNIDNIESTAGIDPSKLIQCHGSWATATCRKCKQSVPGTEIEADVRAKRVSRCRRCPLVRAGVKRKRDASSNGRPRQNGGYGDNDSDDDEKYTIPEPGVMKPDITFFGEALSSTFFNRFLDHDRHKVDLILVIGTSLTVAPVSEIPHAVDATVPQIYISHDNVKHIDFDIILRGDCDVIASELARRAGWPLQHPMVPPERAVTVTVEDETKGVWLVEPKADHNTKPDDNIGMTKVDEEIKLPAPGSLSIPVAQMRSNADADPAAPGAVEVKPDVPEAASTASDIHPGAPEAMPAAPETKLADIPAAKADPLPTAARSVAPPANDSQAPTPPPHGHGVPSVGFGTASM